MPPKHISHTLVILSIASFACAPSAHAADLSPYSDTITWGVAFAMLLLVAAIASYIAWLLHTMRVMLADANVSKDKLDLFTQLPGGLPEGTVRAVLSLVVVIGGILGLVFAGHIGFDKTDAVTGIISSIVTFYFTTRLASGSDGAGAVARDAIRQSVQAGARADQADILRKDAETQLQAAKDDLGAQLQTATATTASLTGQAQQAVASTDALGRARDLIETARIAATVAGGIVPSLAAGGGVQKVLDRAEQGLTAAQHAIDSKDPAAVADAATFALQVVKDVTGADHPATQIIGDAIAGFRGGLGASALLGLGGPVGLIAAVGLGAFQALQKGNEYFERWKARVLDRPYTSNLFPPGPIDGAVALSALEAAPIFTRALLDPVPADQRRARAVEIATAARQDLAAARQALYVPEHFASADEFEAGLQEFRRALLDGLLGPLDSATIDISPALKTAGSVGQQALRDVMGQISHDQAASKGLDSVVLMLTSLATRPDMTQDRMAALLGVLLPAAEAVAAKAQSTETTDADPAPRRAA